MAKDHIELGTTPYDEDCLQIGSPNYYDKVKKEAEKFKRQLIYQFGEPPEGAYFAIKGFGHDFGQYYELCIVFDTEIVDAVDYAFHLERNLPEKWLPEFKN